MKSRKEFSPGPMELSVKEKRKMRSKDNLQVAKCRERETKQWGGKDSGKARTG